MGFTVVVGTFVGVGVGVGAGVFVASAEVPDDFAPSPRNERHPAESRQRASSRVIIANTVDSFIEWVYSPGYLIDFGDCVKSTTNLKVGWTKCTLRISGRLGDLYQKGAVASTVDDEFFTSKEFAFQPQTQQHQVLVHLRGFHILSQKYFQTSQSVFETTKQQILYVP